MKKPDTSACLHSLLEENGLTLYSFAQRSGISLSTLYGSRRQGTSLSADTVQMICDFFQIPFWAFYMTQEERRCYHISAHCGTEPGVQP